MSASPKKKMRFCKNKSKYYSKLNKEQYLAPGMQGFMVTCNFREKECIREAYNILNHFADEILGPEQQNPVGEVEKEESNGDDISDQLEREVNAAKNEQKPGQRRFKSVDTGSNNCIFIRSIADVDPVELVSRVVDDIKSKGEQRTRFLLRLVPIEAVCHIDQLIPTAGKLFDKHFLKSGSSYSIVINRRLNNDAKRETIIDNLAELVKSKNVGNRVDLKNPEKTVLVEIIKRLCLISVITGYIQNKKYNLVELANVHKSAEHEENLEKAEAGENVVNNDDEKITVTEDNT